MKYSRDLARLKQNDKEFDKVIDQQVSNIAKTGANYIAIGTPYDDEFRGFQKRWVQAARRHNLRVWFRGNFAGWEQWFEYPKIDYSTHIEKTTQYILNNRELFRDGDIFTPCPECEQGAKLQLGEYEKVEAHRKFLTEEYMRAKQAMSEIGKDVRVGYYSMNGDVAARLMDKETTAALGGVVVIDHYVPTTERLVNDIRQYAQNSGGTIILGEFGAPIPDLNGKMTEEEQSAWLNKTLTELAFLPELTGLNYWVNTGGTTGLWDANGVPRKAVKTLTEFY